MGAPDLLQARTNVSMIDRLTGKVNSAIHARLS